MRGHVSPAPRLLPEEFPAETRASRCLPSSAADTRCGDRTRQNPAVLSAAIKISLCLLKKRNTCTRLTTQTLKEETKPEVLIVADNVFPLTRKCQEPWWSFWWTFCQAQSTQDARRDAHANWNVFPLMLLAAVWTLPVTSIGSISFASHRASCVDWASKTDGLFLALQAEICNWDNFVQKCQKVNEYKKPILATFLSSHSVFLSGWIHQVCQQLMSVRTCRKESMHRATLKTKFSFENRDLQLKQGCNFLFRRSDKILIHLGESFCCMESFWIFLMHHFNHFRCEHLLCLICLLLNYDPAWQHIFLWEHDHNFWWTRNNDHGRNGRLLEKMLKPGIFWLTICRQTQQGPCSISEDIVTENQNQDLPSSAFSGQTPKVPLWEEALCLLTWRHLLRIPGSTVHKTQTRPLVSV